MTVSLPNDQDASGRSFGEAELELLREVLASGTLTSTKGTMVARLEQDFSELLGVGHTVGCASGSAAVHTAVAALDAEPGQEVVTTSVTDMGALTPILYQGLVPVFADVDARTGNVTAATVEAALSDRTAAVVVTHLFGNPADLAGIRAVCEPRGIRVIEDCAQAFLASSDGETVGTRSWASAFSLQQGKHITTGEGGLVTAPDAATARELRLFVNKSWPYGEPQPDHRTLALNYRLTELQGAVALAQLARLPDSVATRVANAALLTDALTDLDGLQAPEVRPQDGAVYWRYALHVDPDQVPGGPSALAGALKGYDVASAPRYIVKPAFRCAVIAEQKTFGSSRWPWTLARPEVTDYAPERFPGTFAFLDSVLVLGWNERYTAEHVAHLADSLTGALKTVRDQA